VSKNKKFKQVIKHSCLDKVVFLSHEEAKIHCMMQVYKWNDKGISPYKCKFCKNWHVGHSKVMTAERYHIY